MNCHRIILASLVMVMVLQKISAGPASSLALTIQARTAKIPRTIRTPYENTGIMTARGFGKRSESLRLIDFPSSVASSSSSVEFEEKQQQQQQPLVEWAFDESDERGQFSVNFLVNELMSHPGLLRELIRRFVDVNDDGIVSQRELMMGRVQ